MSTVVQGILLAVIGVLLFGLIIFIHEFGHFFTAKLSHVCVNEFSIGMGPKLFSFTRGETQYSLRLLLCLTKKSLRIQHTGLVRCSP